MSSTESQRHPEASPDTERLIQQVIEQKFRGVSEPPSDEEQFSHAESAFGLVHHSTDSKEKHRRVFFCVRYGKPPKKMHQCEHGLVLQLTTPITVRGHAKIDYAMACPAGIQCTLMLQPIGFDLGLQFILGGLSTKKMPTVSKIRTSVVQILLTHWHRITSRQWLQGPGEILLASHSLKPEVFRESLSTDQAEQFAIRFGPVTKELQKEVTSTLAVQAAAVGFPPPLSKRVEELTRKKLEKASIRQPTAHEQAGLMREKISVRPRPYVDLGHPRSYSPNHPRLHGQYS
ncbi:hypothetical protein FN846DRAFT_891433 [Sphaerosporella brunnea]|uniref:Uncharacterized protein n=1 Tax=Sphaerosporella brunnea TaxID=1250544 RepID=A0A5J5ESP6_9PEZI|nr:hypothetical protein FN846DRAFT_891433 [Sphaerosporella brunnea]